jgi:hypothetical protein
MPPASIDLLKPYSQVQDLSGPLREKPTATAGYACPNSDCLYYGITDDQIHALVGCGGHSRQQSIQDLKCQACQTTPARFAPTESARRLACPQGASGSGRDAKGRGGGASEFGVRFGPALYHLKTTARSSHRVLVALIALVRVGACASPMSIPGTPIGPNPTPSVSASGTPPGPTDGVPVAAVCGQRPARRCVRVGSFHSLPSPARHDALTAACWVPADRSPSRSWHCAPEPSAELENGPERDGS